MDLDVTSSLNQQLARTRRYAEILTDFARVAPATSDIDHLLQLACVQAARGIGISHSKMLRYRPEAGDLLMVAGVGWKPGVVGHTSLGSGRRITSRAGLPDGPGGHCGGYAEQPGVPLPAGAPRAQHRLSGIEGWMGDFERLDKSNDAIKAGITALLRASRQMKESCSGGS